MKNASILAWMLAISCVCSAAAEEGGWNLPKFKHPFAKKDSGGKPPAKKKKPLLSGFKLPTLPKPQFMKSDKGATSSGPSVWAKMNRGAKDAFNKTKNALSFKKDEEPQGGTPVRQAGYSRTPEPKKESIFTRWLPGRKKEEEPPRSPHQFLSQPRPR